LNRLLDYGESQVVAEALQAMAVQAGSRSRVEQQGFKGRLQVLALTSPFAEVRRLAEEILDEL
jgi:hypothetical protein